ncbi:hypothetical protein [Noviherbaspirillum galbum]|uniref:Pyridoxamine 5'-phosphate oxidase putative domain-containing protein n=1 Tax=Noviherbaspirillum galbum TaxID=2709383 RepID=A0A6B3SNA6_9BURK|nr:hypothetical protein [Noviherbaspirillum galbum]NEX62294.1 hypothetical protein [Noviherbaspirillum galbum]
MSPSRSTVSRLDGIDADFMQAGVSLVVGAASNDKSPAIVRATGCRLLDDLGEVSIVVSASQGAEVLRCIRENGAVAVVFSQPSTHRTIQLKGKDARVVGATAEDRESAVRYRDLFATELAPLGFEPLLIRTLLDCPPADLVAIRFTPEDAFIQTPGPNAGQRLAVAP